MKVTIKELTIESDSDFSHVNIDFSKGQLKATPGIVQEYETHDTTEPKKPKKPIKDTLLDLDEEFIPESNEVVLKPVIEETERAVLVSSDMTNATF